MTQIRSCVVEYRKGSDTQVGEEYEHLFLLKYTGR